MSQTPPAGPPSAIEGPPPIPNHTLLHRVGAGSYGEVWLARDLLGTLRAVKIVHRHSFDSNRPYEREFAGLQKFEPISRRHESQLDILHVGRDDARGCFYYVMELADSVSSSGFRVPGSTPVPPADPQLETRNPEPGTYVPRTLRSDLQRHGRLPIAECTRLGLALATALEHLHSHGLVHRDIKPSNIVFVEGQPKLADIGLVTDADATMSLAGTDGYIPPEGHGTPPADLFSLGKVLYEIGNGRDRKEFPDLPADFAQLPDAAKEELREFNAIVLKACQPRAADRYATAAALRESLEILRAGKSVRRQQTLEHQLAQAKTWGWWAGAVLVLAVGGLFAWQWKKSVEAKLISAQAGARVAAASNEIRVATAAETGARRQLLLNEVQMARQGARTNGWFDASWAKLREISRLQPGADDARTQAAACLSGLDARLVDADTNAGAFSLAYSSDGQTLLCAGVTDKRGKQQAHLWRVPVDQTSRSSRREEAHSSPGKDHNLLTSAATNQKSVPEPLPVSGDAVAAWRPDGTTNGTPVLFLPGPTNRFVLVEAATSNVLQEFTLEGNPSQGNENHPVLALTLDARYAAASVTLDDSSDSLAPAEGERAGVRGKAATDDRSADGPSASSAEVSRGRAVRAPTPQGRFAVWDTATVRALFQTNEPASALAFSPDGRALAVGDAEGRVRVFSVPDFALLAEFPSARVRINCFAFTRDPIVPRPGPLTNAWWLAIGDASGVIRIHRTGTQELLAICRGSAQDVFTMAFHPDGVTLAAAGRGDVRFWDAAAGHLLLRIPQGQGVGVDYARALAFASGGETFALGNEQQNEPHFISRWRCPSTRGVRDLRGLSAAVMRAWFSPDGQRLAAMAADWRLGVWDRASGRLMHIFETANGDTADNAAVAFHPDGIHLAFSCADEAALADLNTGELQHPWPLGWGFADEMTYTADARLLLLRRESTNGIQRPFRWLLRELDETSGSRVLHEQTNIAQWRATAFALLPDGRHFAVFGHGTEPEASRETHFFEIASGQRLWSIDHHMDTAPTTVVDPFGRFLLYANGGPTMLCSLPGGERIGPVALRHAISPEAAVLASYAPVGCEIFFGRSTNAPALLLGADLKPSGYRQPVFSRAGRQLAWGTEAGFVLVADWGEVRQRLRELELDVNAP